MSGRYEIYALQLPLPGTLSEIRALDVAMCTWRSHNNISEINYDTEIDRVLSDQYGYVYLMADLFFANLRDISIWWLENTIAKATSLPILVRDHPDG